MNISLIGLPFFQSISQGWITYFRQSSGPKFTEEQIRMADEAAGILDNCHPITDVISPQAHMQICQNLGKDNFFQASMHLDKELPSLFRSFKNRRLVIRMLRTK
jgi:hypothetical protein